MVKGSTKIYHSTSSMESVWRALQLRREDLLMYGGVIFFLLFILYNVKLAYDRGALWLPSKYLVLSGLVLQLAAEAEVKNVSISGPHQQDEVEKLMAKQLSIDFARLTLCVFVGYSLPGMGTTAYKGVWTTIAALLISLVTHIFMECVIAVQIYIKGNARQVGNQSWVWLILSGGLLSLLLFSFFIGMVYAILIAKYYRDNLSERIKALLDETSNNVEMEREKLKEEVLKSWILARVCQPDYISARTAYSAGVGVAVTVCVAFFGIKVIWLRSLLNRRLGLFLFQSVFILVGWVVILYRWLGPLYYFVLFRQSNPKPKSELRAFWGMVNTPVSHLLRSLFSIIVHVKMLKFILPVLLTPLLIWQMLITEIVMRLTVMCWKISWRVFDNKLIKSLSNAYTKVKQLESSEDFGKYKEALESLRTPAEDVAGLWIANKRCFECVKLSMENAYEEGLKCTELIKVIQSCNEENNLGFFADRDEIVQPLPSVKKYFPGLKEPLWSITAVSLLNIIIQVTPVNAVDDAVKAFEQAYPLMDLVDCPDNIDITVDNFGSSNLQSFLISQASSDGKAKVMTSYSNMKRKQQAAVRAETELTLKAALHIIVQKLRGTGRSETTSTATLELEGAKDIIQKKLEDAKSILIENQLLGNPGAGAIGVEWLFMAPNYADYKVCNFILADSDCYSSVDELRAKLIGCLKDVISSCVLHLPNMLFKKIRDWAAELEEEKIYKAAQIVGKALGVIDAAKKMGEATPESTASQFRCIQA